MAGFRNWHGQASVVDGSARCDVRAVSRDMHDLIVLFIVKLI